MAAILIGRAFPMFRLIVGVQILRRGQNRGAHINHQMNIAREMNRAAEISARRQINRSPTGVRCGLNRFINRRTIEIFSITGRAIIADVIIIFICAIGGEKGGRQKCLRNKHRRNE